MRQLLERLLRFWSVGSMGSALQLSVLAGLTSLGGLHYLVATALAVEAAILHNFLWHQRWTWRDRTADGRALNRLLRFNGTSGALSIIGNLLFMKLYVGGLALPPVLGNVLAIASCSVVNFLVNDRLVFV